MNDHEKNEVMGHESCVTVCGDRTNDAIRTQINTYTSDIGVVTQTITWPNPVGHKAQGWHEGVEVLSNYTGPKFNEYGIEV